MNPFEVQSVSNLNFITDNLTLNCRSYNSEQNLNFSFSAALSGLKDFKINNYSGLFLTSRQNLNNILSTISLSSVNSANLTNFSTNLAFNNADSLVYLSVDEDTFNTAGTSQLSLVSASNSNNNFFDIAFLDKFNCKISHTFQENTRYLTVDTDNNIVFADDTGTNFLGSESPQIFYYIFDIDNNILVLYKRIFNVPTYVSQDGAKLILQDISNNLSIPYTSVIFVQSINISTQLPNNYNAHYTPDFKSNTLNISSDLSRNNIPKSLLIHSELEANTDTNLKVNYITLKNSRTPENNTALIDNYMSSDLYSYRDYDKIFTGSHQEEGAANITLSYSNYTTQIKLKAGKVTHFHIPYDLYPYKQLNINDTDLIYKGAIAGSVPLQSDKIFKKRADYKYSSSFGSTLDETNGQYLCTWLSAGSVSPIWVDRYYNPQSISKNEALSAFEPISVTFTDTFTNISEGQPVFFDKISDLVFECGGLYAYHHLDQQYTKNYVNILSTYQVATIPDTDFQGNNYVNIPDITPIYSANQFTITFDMYSEDWSVPFANQIIGNYIQNGFGVFNQNSISPFIYYWMGNQLFIYNTDLTLLHTASFESNIKGAFRKENLQDYYLILESNKILQISTDQTEKFASETSIINFTSVLYTLNTPTSGFLIIQHENQKKLLGFDFITYNIVDLTASSIVNLLSGMSISDISTIDYNNSKIYCTNKSIAQRSANDIFYLDNSNLISRWDTTNNTTYPFLSTFVPIHHFNIDKDGYIWILYGDKLAKVASNKSVLLSQTLSTTNNINVDFITELNQGSFYYNIIVTSQDSNKITITKYKDTGEIINQSTNALISDPLYNVNASNGSYNRQNLYNSANMNALVSLQDKLDSSQFLYLNNVFPTLSSIGSGFHNFCIKLDGDLGKYSIYIDGINVSTINFDKNRYSLVNKLQKNMYVGAIPFYNGTTLSDYTQQPNSFIMGNVQMINVHVYNKALPDSDILLIGNANKSISDISFEIFTGKRSFLDEVDSFLKMETPGFISNYYNLNIKNTNITDPTIKAIFESRFKTRLKNIMPGYSNLKGIVWI